MIFDSFDNGVNLLFLQILPQLVWKEKHQAHQDKNVGNPLVVVEDIMTSVLIINIFIMTALVVSSEKIMLYEYQETSASPPISPLRNSEGSSDPAVLSHSTVGLSICITALNVL